MSDSITKQFNKGFKFERIIKACRMDLNIKSRFYLTDGDKKKCPGNNSAHILQDIY